MEAIKWQIDEFTKRSGTTVSFITNIEEDKFSDEIATGVFRIFQESLTNIARHAKASQVTCELLKSDILLLLSIVDNGIGFDISKSATTISLGLLGIKERVYILNGNFEITSKPGKGTKIAISIPLKESPKPLI